MAATTTSAPQVLTQIRLWSRNHTTATATISALQDLNATTQIFISQRLRVNCPSILFQLRQVNWPGPQNTESLKLLRKRGGEERINSLSCLDEFPYFLYYVRYRWEINLIKSMVTCPRYLVPLYWFYILKFSSLPGERLVILCSFWVLLFLSLLFL